VFVLTVDQQGSRRAGDRVPEAIHALSSRVPTPVLPFERTAGDEFQGVLGRADDVLEAVTVLARLGSWSIGIGIGEVEHPLPAGTREARGDAFVLAREAVEAARDTRDPRLAVRSADRTAGADAEAALRLLLVVLRQRSRPAWEAADLVRGGATQAEAARVLGVTRQAVGQRLAAAHLDVEDAVAPVMVRLLEAAA
jgi:hypothetical protein